MAASSAPPSPSTPVREPGSSQGMTSVRPAKDQPLRDETQALQEPDPADTGLALPHERDQSSDMTNAETDSQVEQASRDLRRGLQDTDKGKPMNDAYKKLKR